MAGKGDCGSAPIVGAKLVVPFAEHWSVSVNFVWDVVQSPILGFSVRF